MCRAAWQGALGLLALHADAAQLHLISAYNCQHVCRLAETLLHWTRSAVAAPQDDEALTGDMLDYGCFQLHVLSILFILNGTWLPPPPASQPSWDAIESSHNVQRDGHGGGGTCLSGAMSSGPQQCCLCQYVSLLFHTVSHGSDGGKPEVHEGPCSTCQLSAASWEEQCVTCPRSLPMAS